MESPAASDPSTPASIPRWRLWLPRALFESALIVLSVLLALVVNEWREDRQQAERAEIALQSIGAELRDNLQSVERARAKHLAMQDSLRAYAALGQAPPVRVYMDGIFDPALVHSTAWDSARETGVTGNLPFGLVLELSQIYDQQARYQELGDALVQDLMSQIRREGMEAVLRDNSVTFIPLQEDFANREDHLAEAYEGALEELSG